MKKTSAIPLLLVAGAALAGLTGCERIEQAATEAVDRAQQTAAQALDEARQNGSLQQLQQAADEVLRDARREAAGLLQEAGKRLSEGESAPAEGSPPAAEPGSAI